MDYNPIVTPRLILYKNQPPSIVTFLDLNINLIDFANHICYNTITKQKGVDKMIDNELLLAISGLLDTKLEPIKADIKQLKLDNENMIKPALNLVTENYLSTTSLKSNIENII